MEFETHLTSESFFKFFVTSATYPITANVWRKNDSLMFKRVNRLDPPWRPNGPSERVLKGTMPSSTFDAQHISPLQPFSKVIISDPGKHLKFRIFLKIFFHQVEKKIKFFLFIFSPDHGILSTKKVVPKKKISRQTEIIFPLFFQSIPLNQALDGLYEV